jgi:hypothetical protein
VRVTFALPGVAITELGDIGALLTVFVLLVWPAQPIANNKLRNSADPDFQLELAFILVDSWSRYRTSRMCGHE